MSDIASLSLEMKSDGFREGVAEVKEFVPAASAAERAADKLKIGIEAAGRTSEEFSRRVRNNIASIEFQTAQLSRSAVEQERYTALKRAGVAAESAAGQAITQNVRVLQAQRQAQQDTANAMRLAQQQAAGYAALAARSAAADAEQVRLAKMKGDAVAKLVADLEFERVQLGRTAVERAQYEALRRTGVTAASAEGQSIMATVAALHREREAVQQLEETRRRAGVTPQVGMTAQQRLMLGYQLNDIFTQAAMGTNPALIAAQQGPQITQIFGGLRNTLSAIPMPLLVGGGAALAAGGVLAIANALKDMNDALETQKRRLGDVLGDQRLAAQAMADIRREAIATGDSLEDVTARWEKFSRAGVFVGASGSQVAGLTTMLSQLGRLGGSTKEEQSSAGEALAKSLKESVVSAQNVDTILEAMPTLGRRIADGLGTSVVQLRLMAQAGDLTNRQVFDALLAQQDKVQQKFKETGLTVGGFFSELWRTIEDVSVATYKLVTGIELVASKAEAARRAQEANPNRPQRATPRVIGGRGLDEQVLSGELGQTADAVLNDPRRLQAQLLDTQRALSAAAGEAVLAASKVAASLDPLAAESRQLQQQLDAVDKGLEALQSGLSGVDTSKAVEESKRLTDVQTVLRTRLLETRDAYGQALEAVTTRQQQAELGLTPGQRAAESRIQQLMASRPGVSRDGAQTVVDAEQLQMLDDMIAKESRHLVLQQGLTQAMRGGKVAADQFSVAMTVMGIAFEQLGTITPELAVKLDVLADILEKLAEQSRLQGGIDASKPFIADLEGIAAAMKMVEQGAYAMKRAEAEARAARDESGTGQLQMQVFDARQLLADATLLANLKQETQLTDELAKAAGNVAAQKEIQLQYDIKRAQLEASPESSALIAERMRARAVANTNLETANGAAELERQVDLTKQQADLVRSGSADYAEQLAILQKKNELLARGVDLESEAAQRQITAAGNLARANVDLQRAQDAADATKRVWMNAYDSVQKYGADTIFAGLKGQLPTVKSVADAVKDIFFRTIADIAAAFLIRPLIAPIFMGAQAAGLMPASAGPATYGNSGGFSMPGFGGLGFGSGSGSLFGDFGTWLNTPFIGGSPILGPLQPGAASLGVTGGLTPLGALGGAASIGLGAYNLLTSKSLGGQIGGGLGILGGGLGLAAALSPALSFLGPIGIGAGLLGAFLPGLLGGSPPPPPKVMATGGLNFNAGQWNYSGSEYNGGQGLGGTLGGVGGTMKSLMDAAGVKSLTSANSLNYQTLSQGDFSNATTFVNGMKWGQGSGNDAGLDTAAAHIAHMIMMEAGSGISDMMRHGLGNYGQQNLDHAFSTQELATAVSELKAFEDVMKDLGRTISSAETALKGIDDRFKALTDTAEKYGLDTAKIEDEQARARTRVATDFAEGLQRQYDDLTGNKTTGALADIQKAYDEAIANNKYLVENVKGATDQILLIEKLFGAERAKVATEMWQEVPELARSQFLFTQRQALNDNLAAYDRDTAAIGANPMATQIAQWNREAGLMATGVGDTFGIGSQEYADATLAASRRVAAQMTAANDNFRAGLEDIERSLKAPGVANIEQIMEERGKTIATAAALDGPYFDGILHLGPNVEAAMKAFNAKIIRVADDFAYSISQGLLAFTDPLQAQINDLNKQRDEALATARANNAAVEQISREQTDRIEALDKIRTDDLYAIRYTEKEAEKAGRALSDVEVERIRKWQEEADLAKTTSDQVAADLAAMGNHYVSLLDVQELYRRKQLEAEKQFYDQSLGAIDDVIKRVTVGDLSGETATNKLDAAAGSYTDLLSRARGNDAAALQQIGTVAADYVKQQMDFSGSATLDFQTLRQQVAADLIGLDLGVRSGSLGQNAPPPAANQNVVDPDVAAALTFLKDKQDRQDRQSEADREENKALRQQLNDLAAVLRTLAAA